MYIWRTQPMPKAEPGGWGENKTERIAALVTQTAKTRLMEQAAAAGLSLGEFLERLARGQVAIELPNRQKQLLGEWLPN